MEEKTASITAVPINCNELPNNLDSKYAIRGVDIHKNYKKREHFILAKNTVILENLNINVIKGHIYGLLGPSGCGKTTLLKCLIGLLDINSGQIIIDNELKNNNRSSNFRISYNKLGYMPQDYCLYKELTLSETLYYFGRLMSMKPNLIKQRESFLINLLDLPSRNSFVGHLSGGQLRRTSFAVSLLNEPSILMLDEPTVGMDPILRKKIWDYLIDLSQTHQTTIIITTHYIEEARQANYLGFMRKGKIIEEGSPQTLMIKYNHNILEDVFYAICLQEKKN